jgi:hypothetical protein
VPGRGQDAALSGITASSGVMKPQTRPQRLKNKNIFAFAEMPQLSSPILL